MKTKFKRFSYHIREHHGWVEKFSAFCANDGEFLSKLDDHMRKVARKSCYFSAQAGSKAELAHDFGDDQPGPLVDAAGPFVLLVWKDNKYTATSFATEANAEKALKEEELDYGREELHRDQGGHAGPCTRIDVD